MDEQMSWMNFRENTDSCLHLIGYRCTTECLHPTATFRMAFFLLLFSNRGMSGKQCHTLEWILSGSLGTSWNLLSVWPALGIKVKVGLFLSNMSLSLLCLLSILCFVAKCYLLLCCYFSSGTMEQGRLTMRGQPREPVHLFFLYYTGCRALCAIKIFIIWKKRIRSVLVIVNLTPINKSTIYE